jgi:uncharacterized protein (TIGR03083 family)
METPTHVVQVLRGEVERLTQYLQTLPPDAWRQPSACALWEVRDVVGHLTWMAERFRGTVSRAVRGDVSPPAGSPPMGTSTQAGRRSFVARQALACRESLGDQVFPTFRAQMNHYLSVLAQLGPQEWEKPAYSALRLVPLWTYPYLTLREVAIHAWDIRSQFDPAARLAVESVPVLMQGLALQIGPPWDAACGQEARQSRPVRARWVVTGVVPGQYDIVAANGTCRIEPASAAVADVSFRGEAETVVLVLYGRLTLEAAITTGCLRTEGEPGLVAAFARWLQGGLI